MIRRILFFLICVLVLSDRVSAERIRFAVLGDTQGSEVFTGGEVPLDRIVRDTLSASPSIQFVIIAGDLVEGTPNTYDQLDLFRSWRKVADPWYQADLYGLKVYPVPGNHDQKNYLTYLRTWQESFPELPDNGPKSELKSTYSFDVGPCHFVGVNTSIPQVFMAHRVDTDWLRKDLAESNKPFKFVFGHEPAYKMTFNAVASMDCQQGPRDEFWQILSEYGVQAYFCGHDHGYDHWAKDGVHQIITAGGGGHGFYHYLIVDVDEQDVTVSVYRQPENTLYEQYKLSDTQNVAGEDRTVNDHPYWPYDWPFCMAWGLTAMVFIELGFTGLRASEP